MVLIKPSITNQVTFDVFGQLVGKQPASCLTASKVLDMHKLPSVCWAFLKIYCSNNYYNWKKGKNHVA